MFVGKARSQHWIQAPLALLAKKLNKAGKACQGQTLYLIYYKENYKEKKFCENVSRS
jgi:hypothetical protein